ncbi:MAG: hypothetical protein EP330_27795 [Deltaproteobacteria bacterium]|nr:MAG: hypothetical protein EP330_27795 [Deltaproteobacteria bacterium]
MTELPSNTLQLLDSRLQSIGFLRLARTSDDAVKGDCIFDIAEPGDDARSETRWLHKRRYQRMSEHRFAVEDDGRIKITGPEFRVFLAVDEESGDLVTEPPAPRVFARWA